MIYNTASGIPDGGFGASTYNDNISSVGIKGISDAHPLSTQGFGMEGNMFSFIH